MNHRYSRCLLFFAFNLWCQIWLIGQSEYKVNAYSTKDGLSSDVCRNMLRDKAGFLWITTNNGLNRFDGNSFYTFKHRPNDSHSISNNSCYGLLEDRKGRLWVNTDDGLSLYNNKKQTFDNFYPDSIVMPSLGISYTEMAEDHLGRIWMGGYFDVLIFDPKRQKFERSGWYDFARKSGLIPIEKRNSISQSILRKSETELWLMTVYGLFSVHTPTKKYTYHPNPLIYDYFAFVIKHIDDNGVLWIGSYDQCFYSYDPKNKLWKSYTCPPHDKNISNHISSISELDKTTLLLTRSDILFKFSKDTEKFTKFTWKPLADLKIEGTYSLTYFAKDHIYMIKLGDKPFIHLKSKRAIIRKTKIPLPTNTKNNHSYVTSSGQVLAGDWDKNAVFICDSVKCENLHDENGNKALGNLQIFFASQNGTQYFSTSKNVYSWSGTNKIVNKIKIPVTSRDTNLTEFRNFTEDIHGNIYVRERSKGIFWMKKKGQSLSFFDCGVNGSNYSALYYERSTEKLWLALEKGGLYIIDPKTRQSKKYPIATFTKVSNGFIYDIVGNDKGDVFLLIANRGVVKINAKAMVPKLYTTADGLISDDVHYGLVDKNGVFWFSSESGLMAFDEKHDRFFSFENEINSKIFEYRLFPDQNGDIAQNHYPDYTISMDHKSIFEHQEIPHIYLKDVKLSGKIIPNDTIYSVPFNRNNFVFQFGNLGESTLRSTQYQYRINQGLWQPLENSSISLYNLAPDEYTIEVANKYHLDRSFVMQVIVTPPWWKTSWFYILMASILALLTYGLYKNRVNIIRKEESEKNQLKQRIAAIEMTALRAQMNPHFIFNCLNSINRFILVNDTDAASEYLTKFSRLIRMILDGSRDNFIGLDRELDALRLYIDMESMRFQKSFTWKINIDHDVNTSDILVPPLLLQPYVENAIWHGIMQAPEGQTKNLHIHICKIESDIIIEITDNGIGREKAKQLKSKTGDQHKSHGIALTEERLNLMQKLNGIKAYVQIQDLLDSVQKPLGTKVVITLKQS